MGFVKVDSVTKSYGDLLALNNISFEIDRGEIVGYLGPNGSGKTTTLQTITDLIHYDDGHVFINNYEVKNNQKKNISVVFDSNGLYPRLSVEENLEFFCRLKGFDKKKRVDIINYYLNEFQLESRRHSIVKKLSKGMQRKLTIARALLFEPELLLLDEPFDGIDIESRERILKMIKEISKQRNIAVFLTSHVMADIEELADRIIIINKGSIIKNESRVDLMQESIVSYIHIKLGGEYEETYLRRIFNDLVEVQQMSFNMDEVILSLSKDQKLDIPSILFQNSIKFEEIYTTQQNLTETYLSYIKK